jgi:predicted nucleotide-binding protein (sugar kinase/HSP70/actin superfamily)
MGYRFVNLPKPSRASLDYALKAVNNEVCYPALCVIGDLLSAVESGKYQEHEIALGITQTSGQCRATNYIALIKRALINAGHKDIPVIAVSVSAGTINDQPGLDLDYKKVIFSVLHAMCFADALSRLYYATVSRELDKGASDRLKEDYLNKAVELIRQGRNSSLLSLLKEAVQDFNSIPVGPPTQVIGIIGEIYVKYNSFGNYGIVDWLISQGIEVSIPPVTNFFTQGFVNSEAKHLQNILPHRHSFNLLSKLSEKVIASFSRKYEKPLKRFLRYKPVESVREEAKLAAESVNLLNQYGEGWLIPGEIAGFARQGINNVVCIQPFGCIANHVIGKGIEKKMKKRFPDINLLFLDFDYGTTQVNVLNRLHFMLMENQDKPSATSDNAR